MPLARNLTLQVRCLSISGQGTRRCSSSAAGLFIAVQPQKQAETERSFTLNSVGRRDGMYESEFSSLQQLIQPRDEHPGNGTAAYRELGVRREKRGGEEGSDEMVMGAVRGRRKPTTPRRKPSGTNGVAAHDVADGECLTEANGHDMGSTLASC